MKDIPYHVLKENQRDYEILMLRDQYGNSFSAIAEACGISAIRAGQLYNRMKLRQIRLYSRHISIALGYESTAKIGREYLAAYDFYQGLPYACAYLEKTYRDILEAYRAGEPGMPRPFLTLCRPCGRALPRRRSPASWRCGRRKRPPMPPSQRSCPLRLRWQGIHTTSFITGRYWPTSRHCRRMPRARRNGKPSGSGILEEIFRQSGAMTGCWRNAMEHSPSHRNDQRPFPMGKGR